MYFTGLTNTLERISPQVIVLSPPEKLVMETRASGGYQHYDWTRNGVPFGTGSFPATVEEFPNFFEIFVREPTTTDDLGVYIADLAIVPGQTQAPDVEFVVTRYGKDHNTSSYHMTYYFRVPVPIENNYTKSQFASKRISLIVTVNFSTSPTSCRLHFPQQTIT